MYSVLAKTIIVYTGLKLALVLLTWLGAGKNGSLTALSVETDKRLNDRGPKEGSTIYKIRIHTDRTPKT